MRDKKSVWISQLERTNERQELCLDLSVGEDQWEKRTLCGPLSWRWRTTKKDTVWVTEMERNKRKSQRESRTFRPELIMLKTEWTLTQPHDEVDWEPGGGDTGGSLQKQTPSPTVMCVACFKFLHSWARTYIVVPLDLVVEMDVSFCLPVVESAVLVHMGSNCVGMATPERVCFTCCGRHAKMSF